MAVVKPIKIVKILKSPVKLKVEKEEEEMDLNIPCRLCTKWFANEVAIRNHLRMEHSGEEVNLEEWIQAAVTQSKEMKKKIKKEIKTKDGQEIIAKKTTDLISKMQPVNMMSLASKNVSYILIKSEDGAFDMGKPSRKRDRSKETITVSPKRPATTVKKEKAIMPISGPFECLQPSTLVAEGTCHQIFFSCCDYSIHFRDEHTRRRKPIKCQVCEKVLAYSIGEEVTSPYSCQVCGSGFQTHTQLSQHVNTAHVKLKPFECSVCRKRFSQQGGVQQHMRMHTGDRPFPCTYCAKSFTQKSGLDQHLRTHTKVKPYRCVVCGKTFVQSVHLKQHMRTHTNVTPFRCVVCDKRFKQSSHLNYHLKHHSEANMTDDQKKRYREFVGMITEQNMIQVVVNEDATAEATANLQQILEYADKESVEMEQEEQEYVEEVEESEIVEDQHIEFVESGVQHEVLTEVYEIKGEEEEGEEEEEEEEPEHEVVGGSADNSNQTWTVQIQ